MTLARVGAGEGPDLQRLAELRARAPDREVFAAGGVRGVDDLAQLREADVAGALIATALHTGTVSAQQLAALADRQTRQQDDGAA